MAKFKFFFRKNSFYYIIERIFPKKVFRKNSFNCIIERIFSKKICILVILGVSFRFRRPKKTDIQNASIDLRLCINLGKRMFETGL